MVPQPEVVLLDAVDQVGLAAVVPSSSSLSRDLKAVVEQAETFQDE